MRLVVAVSTRVASVARVPTRVTSVARVPTRVTSVARVTASRLLAEHSLDLAHELFFGAGTYTGMVSMQIVVIDQE